MQTALPNSLSNFDPTPNELSCSRNLWVYSEHSITPSISFRDDYTLLWCCEDPSIFTPTACVNFDCLNHGFGACSKSTIS